MKQIDTQEKTFLSFNKFISVSKISCAIMMQRFYEAKLQDSRQKSRAIESAQLSKVYIFKFPLCFCFARHSNSKISNSILYSCDRHFRSLRHIYPEISTCVKFSHRPLVAYISRTRVLDIHIYIYIYSIYTYIYTRYNGHGKLHLHRVRA